MTPLFWRSYHPRHNLSQVKLTEYERKAQVQDARILSVMQAFPDVRYTAESLEGFFLSNPILLTSIRRSLTNLERKNKIEYCGHVTGKYGRPINQYRAVRE